MEKIKNSYEEEKKLLENEMKKNKNIKSNLEQELQAKKVEANEKI